MKFSLSYFSLPKNTPSATYTDQNYYSGELHNFKKVSWDAKQSNQSICIVAPRILTFVKKGARSQERRSLERVPKVQLI